MRQQEHVLKSGTCVTVPINAIHIEPGKNGYSQTKTKLQNAFSNSSLNRKFLKHVLNFKQNHEEHVFQFRNRFTALLRRNALIRVIICLAHGH